MKPAVFAALPTVAGDWWAEMSDDTRPAYTVSMDGGATFRLRLEADSMQQAAELLGAYLLKTPDVSSELIGQNGDFFTYRVSDGQRTEEIHVSA